MGNLVFWRSVDVLKGRKNNVRKQGSEAERKA